MVAPTITYAPISITMAPDAKPWDVVTQFFGHYDCRVYLTESAYVDVGRGSLTALLRMQGFEGHVGCVATVGQFVETALRSAILPRGEHRNAEAVNVVFGGVPVFRKNIEIGQIEELNPLPLQPVTIGNAVIISTGAVILPGASIGDGVVIGANAVLRGHAEPFSIYAGAPARKIKDRPVGASAAAASRWWDWSTPYIARHLKEIQSLALRPDSHEYREPSPRFILRTNGIEMTSISIVGFLDGDTPRQITDAPERVQKYVSQIAGPGPKLWYADVWLS